MKKFAVLFASLVACSAIIYGSGMNGGGGSSGGGSGITSINSDSTAAQTISAASSGTDFTVSTSGGTTTLAIPSASATARGLVSTGAQTFAGAKTFSSTIVGSVSGNAATATALAANPTDCGASTYATAIDASGNLTCSAASAAFPLLSDDSYSASTPSYSRSGDSNTGVGFPTADTVSGIAGGVEVSRSTYLAGTYTQLILNPGGPSNGKTPIFYIRPSGTWTTGGTAYISFTDDVTEYVQGPNPRGLGGENGQYIMDHNGTVFALWDKNKNYRLMLRAGGNAASTNTASSGIAAGGTKKVDTTAVGNVGAGTDDLISYTIPASVLGTNNDFIEWTAFGTFGATTTATITCNYGATTLITLSSASAIANDSWEASGTIIRTGATTQVATSRILASLNGTVTTKQSYTAPAETLSGTVVLKCTGNSSNATDNDIVQKALTVNWFPNN